MVAHEDIIPTQTNPESEGWWFWYGLTSGVGSFYGLYDPAVRIPLKYRSVEDALRADWINIGADMKTAIDRKNAELEEVA